MALRMFELVQGFFAMSALALIAFILVAGVSIVAAIVAQFGKRPPEQAPVPARPQLRLVPVEPKPEPKAEPKPAANSAPEEDSSDWLRDFG